MSLKQYKAYLIDLDGTMYRGSERIEEAVTFVQELANQGIPYMFVTNNSTKTQVEVADVLKSFDIPAKPENVYTSSMAASRYVSKQKKGASVYMIGERGLYHALEDGGCRFSDKGVDFVVVGLDRAITYDKIANASLAIRNGAVFIGTNADVALPTERGLLPGSGALLSSVSVATGIKPIIIGKPEPIMIEQALKSLNVEKEEALLVGDNYHTDILAGIRAGVDTLLVHTGVTIPDDVTDLEELPTYRVHSLKEWEIKKGNVV